MHRFYRDRVAPKAGRPDANTDVGRDTFVVAIHVYGFRGVSGSADPRAVIIEVRKRLLRVLVAWLKSTPGP